MSANRKSVRQPIVGLWSANVGYLLAFKIAEGGGCWIHCSKCRRWDELDLAKIIIRKNPLYSLWNRSPRCPCGGVISFHAHHAPGARVIPLITDDPHQTDDLHRRWEIERRKAARMQIPEGWEDDDLT